MVGVVYGIAALAMIPLYYVSYKMQAKIMAKEVVKLIK